MTRPPADLGRIAVGREADRLTPEPDRDRFTALAKEERSASTIEGILDVASAAPALQALQTRLERGGVLLCQGVDPAAHAFLCGVLRRLLPAYSIVLVSEGLKVQERLQDDLETWLDDGGKPPAKPLFYPAWETLPHEERHPHSDVVSERLEVLAALLETRDEGRPCFINTTVGALLQKTFPPDFFKSRARRVGRGDTLPPLDLVEWLEDQGYDSEAQVTQKGELAMRGGILDFFPFTSPWPVRLEFFGDEIESLRLFDPATQVSREEIAEIVIPPGGEFGLLKKMVESKEAPPLATLLDYFSVRTIFILRDPGGLEAQAEHYASQIPEGDPFFVPWVTVREMIRDRASAVLALCGKDEDLLLAYPPSRSDAAEEGRGSGAGACEEEMIRIPIENLDVFRPLDARATEPEVAQEQRRLFFGQLHRWLRQGYHASVLCNTEGEQQRFGEIWEEFKPREGGAPGESLAVGLGALERGFIFEDARLVVVADAEIFGRLKSRRPRRLKSPHAAAANSAFDINFSEIEEGDFVVHLQHGIGRFLGLKLLPAAPVEEGAAGEAPPLEEFLAIEYAPQTPGWPAPKLYVPLNQSYLVGKYVGAGQANPPLNVMGSARWGRAKAQAEEAVQDLAAEFLAIQAARAARPGHAFQPDTTWQREFESAFPFQETPGQMRAIEDTKRDMELPAPMDRLVCGDVGFGKTEVAIRAAFKAVMDGKQTAILAPTTVLAQQHFNTFRERMADFPVRIELLCRFRTRAEQKKVMEGLAAGSVDIVIGTHRLLQADAAFKDLGLVVIDEEQRFGVVHKEKFKRMRRMVDVLTLSATPIPRTLYMALTGARDLSTIETPPQDRLPVETIVAPYDERLIRDAIQREINRGGQVFFLHNRVLDIEETAGRLRSLLPAARIVTGHGQMESDELEDVMARFVNGDADVLLSTTIIESGLDIPNANTIIIDRADRFGLSDLYQLRGRVGRHKHQAYAYLLLPRQGAVLDQARKRISALRQYSTLGSGFKIAMRDLEIRGAGNLLGAEQSGHITAVGFDLYCQLLKRAVAAFKGEKVETRREVSLQLDFLALSPGEESSAPAVSGGRAAAYISRAFIPDTRHRVEIYRKLAQAANMADLAGLRREVEDRFGRVPSSIELLWLVTEMKLLASDKGVTVVESRGDRLMLTRNKDFIMVGGKFPRLQKKSAAGKLNEIRGILGSLTTSPPR